MRFSARPGQETSAEGLVRRAPDASSRAFAR